MGVDGVEDLFVDSGEAGVDHVCSLFLQNPDDLVEEGPPVGPADEDHFQR